MSPEPQNMCDPETPSFFTKMVDELVDFAQYDNELEDGLKWIDSQATKKGINFYEAVFEVLHKYDTDMKAKEWMRDRN